MDPVLDKITEFLDIYMDDFIQEQIRKGHIRLSDNSYYPEVKALTEAGNSIRRLLGHPLLRLQDEVKRRMQEIKIREIL